MAEIKIKLDKNEVIEYENLLEFLKSLDDETKLKFKGFLLGLGFVNNWGLSM